MPSPLNPTETPTDPGADAREPAVTGPAAPADVLARVKAEGLRRRTRRHRRNAVLAVVALALVAVPTVSLLPDGGDEEVTVAADPGQPTTAEDRSDGDGSATSSPGSSTPPSTAAGAAEPAAPAPTAVADPPPSTAPVPPSSVPITPCRNSYDSACGDFRWDPEPGPNGPITAAFVDAPATAIVGEQVTFTVAWTDPDAELAYDHFSPDGVGMGQACTMEMRFGPWTPPDPVADGGELSYTHAFDAPGTYVVVVSIGTGGCNNPYGSDKAVETSITVV